MNRYRLRNIERQFNTDAPCDLCGSGIEPYEVQTFLHGDAGAPVAPEWCAACGRQTAVVVTWGDDPYEPRRVWP